MEEIKVGEYVRTKEGEIIKVREDYDIFTDDDGLFIDAYMLPYEQKIIKHSPNIIDLIEVGDYVNGLRITSREANTLFISNIEHKILYEPIKNIVTKEIFNQVKYEV